MNKKAVQWLYEELPQLIERGVLSQEVADKLHGHYGDVKAVDRKWTVIILCSVLGALLIGLGIILVFAHNWEELSRPVRAVLSLLPLVIAQALAWWVIVKRPTSYALKEGSATFLSLMVGSSLALISQTYNIPSDTPDFMLTWMLLIVPLTYLMQATIPAVMFVFGILMWAMYVSGEPLKSFLFWPFLAVVIPHFIWSLREEIYTIRATILAYVMAIAVSVGAGLTLGKTWPGSWIIIDSSLMTIFYLLGVWEFKGITTNWQKPFQRLGAVGIFIMMFLLTFRLPWESITERHYYSIPQTSSSAAFPDLLLTFSLIGGALLLCFRYALRQDWMRALLGALPLFAMIGYVLGGTSIAFSMLIFNILLLTVSVFRLVSGIRTNNLSVINTGMFMLSALILARFFDSEIGFVLKGLVFIFIGGCFFMTNVMILRRKGGAV